MSERNTSNRRVAGSYAMSLVSITLVLFLLGAFAIFLVHARKLSNHVKENIGFEVVMNSDVKEANILRLQKELDAMPAVKSTEYITKDEAIERLSEDLGEDFLEWLGPEENPLLPSIDVRFHAAYANNDSIALIETMLLENPDVKEVYYQKSLVDLINNNIRKIAIVLMVISLILLLIAIALIRNTIRLSIYSKLLRGTACRRVPRYHPLRSLETNPRPRLDSRPVRHLGHPRRHRFSRHVNSLVLHTDRTR